MSALTLAQLSSGVSESLHVLHNVIPHLQRRHTSPPAVSFPRSPYVIPVETGIQGRHVIAGSPCVIPVRYLDKPRVGRRINRFQESDLAAFCTLASLCIQAEVGWYNVAGESSNLKRP